MILQITLSLQEDWERKPFAFKGTTGNIQGNKWQKSVSYGNIAELFSHIGDDIRDVVFKEQFERQ